MTRNELNEPYRLQREIERDRERLKEMESRAASCGGGFSAAPARSGKSDKVANGAIDIDSLKDQIKAKIAERDMVIARLWAEIDGIADSQSREILKLRHLDCLSFRQIAQRLCKSEDSVRQRHHRIVERLEKVNNM